MNEKRDLRTGKPVWLAYRTSRAPEARLAGDLATDVLVVGHDVVVIDRRGASLGSTPATTALVQFEIDVPLLELARKIGNDKARRAWRRARLAVLNLRGRIAELDLACRMSPRETLYLAGHLLTGSARSRGGDPEL